jgi:hypothetical protein
MSRILYILPLFFTIALHGQNETFDMYYPYDGLLKKMKQKADSLIISAYGEKFFNDHVSFKNNWYAYHGHYDTIDNHLFWDKDFLGSLDDFKKNKANSFKFRYEVRLFSTDRESVELGIDLDSLGNYIPSTDDRWSNYGFEDLKGERKVFNIDTTNAKKIAKSNGLIESDSSKISSFLRWENFQQQTYYDGQFRYYITEFTGKTPYSAGRNRDGMTYRYNVYVFSPWTGEFIEKKKMKINSEWEQGHGSCTGLIPDKD